MKAPRRLVEDQELVAKLIADDERDGPPPEALQGLLKTLDAVAPAAPPQRSSNFRSWISIVGVCAITAALASRNSVLPTQPAPIPTIASPVASPTLESTTTGAATPSETTPVAVVPSIDVSDLPNSHAGVPPSRAPATSSLRKREDPTPEPTSVSNPSAATKPSPRREIELVIAARQALTRGDAQGCLWSIALYEAEFPSGQFVLEEQMMRIEATALAGDRAGARKLAQEHLSRVPGSPYSARIQSLLSTWGEP